MRMVEYDIKKVICRRTGYKKNRNINLLTEFLDSGLDCVKIEDWTQSKARYCASSLANSIKYYHMTGVRAVLYKGEPYLLRTDKINDIRKENSNVIG